ncbi:unnamed protein product [Schistosoma margrebowiei]|uniref:Uncharacterized protein n=1 Tax=Schistosoma margrebowiei TaxID=48269 RepID=A0A183NC38_9TREM|nr:unnamed protein product [Schistosoma margrebowiei]
MILNAFSVFCNCDEICKQPKWKNVKQVIFMNESYRYVSNRSDSNRHIQSHHYYYSQTINLNQPYPLVHGSFNEYKTTKSIKPEFPLKIFESEVSKFKIWPRGVLGIFKDNDEIGQILNYLERELSRQLLNESEFLDLFSCSLFCLMSLSRCLSTIVYSTVSL